MKNNIKLFVSMAIMALVSISTTLLAQPDPGDPGAGGDPGGPALGAPIGGGAGILITLVLAYGAQRWYMQNKKSQVQ